MGSKRFVGAVALTSLTLATAAAAQTASSSSASPTDAATAAATLAKAQADAADAQANAKKDAIAAKQAELDYQRKAIPGSGASAQITAQTDAGKVEAQLLAQHELDSLAKQMAVSLTEAATDGCPAAARHCHSIILVPSSADTSLITWTIFKTRTSSVTKGLVEANKTYTDLLAAQAAPRKPGKGEPKEERFGVAAIGTAVAALGSLASYFVSNTTVGGITVTPNDEVLAAALAVNLRHACSTAQIYYASRAATAASADAIAKMLSDLDDLSYQSKLYLADAQSQSAATKGGPKKDQDTPQSKAWDAVASNLTSAIAAYTALGAAIGDSGSLPLSKVVPEYALYNLIQSSANPYELITTYVSAGGGYYTQTNLWTVFGSVPFHVSGGSAVAYMLVDPKTGAVVTAGTAEQEHGYVPIKNVSAALSEPKTPPSDQCAAAAPTAGR